MTCSEVFERMHEKFQEFKLDDVYGKFQFEIDGPEGGRWYALCQGDRVDVQRGAINNPDVTLSASDKNVVKLAEGRLNPALALATRRVKVKGNWALIAKIKKKLDGYL